MHGVPGWVGAYEAAGIVVIGTVSDVNSTASGNMITSQVTFSVERMVHGPANVSNIGVHVYSGEVNGVRYSLGSTPHFVDGDRYLLLLHPRGPGVAPTIVAAGAGAIRLDASATLPSLSSLVQEWEEICDA